MVETSGSRLRRAGGSISRTPVSFSTEKRRRRAKKAGTFTGRTSENIVTANEAKAAATTTGSTTSSAQLRSAAPISSGASLRNTALGKTSSTIKQSTRDRILAQRASSPRGSFAGHQTPTVERLPFEQRKEAGRQRLREGGQFSQVTIKAPRPFLDQEREIARSNFLEKTARPFVQREQQKRADAARPSTAIERLIPGLKTKGSDSALTKGAKGFVSGTAEGAVVGAALGSGALSTSVVTGGTVGAVGTIGGAGAILTGAGIGAAVVGTGIATVKATQLNIESGKAGIAGFKKGFSKKSPTLKKELSIFSPSVQDSGLNKLISGSSRQRSPTTKVVSGFKGAVSALGNVGKQRRAAVKEFAIENAETIGRVSGSIFGGIGGFKGGQEFTKAQALQGAKVVGVKPQRSIRTGKQFSPRVESRGSTDVKIGDKTFRVKGVERINEQVFQKQGFARGTGGRGKFNVFEQTPKGQKFVGQATTKSESLTTLGDKQKFDIFTKVKFAGKEKAILTKGTASKVLDIPSTKRSFTTLRPKSVKVTSPLGKTGFQFKAETFSVAKGKVSQDPFFRSAGVSGRTRGFQTIRTSTKSLRSSTTVKELFKGQGTGSGVRPKIKTPGLKVLKAVERSKKAQFAATRGEPLIPRFERITPAFGSVSRVAPAISITRPVLTSTKAVSFAIARTVFGASSGGSSIIGGAAGLVPVVRNIPVNKNIVNALGGDDAEVPALPRSTTKQISIAKIKLPADVTSVTTTPVSTLGDPTIAIPRTTTETITRRSFVGDPFIPRPRVPPPELPFDLPFFGGGLGFVGGRRKGTGKTKRKFKYAPSLVAIEKQIKGKRPKVITGFGVRPLKVRM